MRSNERRRLLKLGAVTGTTAVLGLQTITATASADNGMIFDFEGLENPEWVKSQLPEQHAFEELLGDVFWVRYDDYGPMLNLTLEEVISTSEYSFILRFHTADSRRLSQVTHLVEHARLGRTPMFLVANPVTDSEHLEGFEIGGKQKEPNNFYYEVTLNYTPVPPEQKALIPQAVDFE